MIKFSIPDSAIVRDLNILMLRAFRDHREWFYEDFIIETAYGCPLFSPWNGNRSTIELLKSPTLDGIADLYDSYREYQVDYRLTFTNFLLRTEHLYDTVGNALARVLNEKGGYVTLSIPLMENHIRINYPNLKICWSVTTEYYEGVNTINEVLSKDMIVILPIEYNNNEEVLQKLVHKENVEILLNENCVDNCPRRKEHFTRANQIHLLERYPQPDDEICFFSSDFFPGLPRTRVVDRKGIEMCVKNGVDHFKIAGRQDDNFTFGSYLEYLVLPDRGYDFAHYLKNNGMDYMNYFAKSGGEKK